MVVVVDVVAGVGVRVGGVLDGDDDMRLVGAWRLEKGRGQIVVGHLILGLEEMKKKKKKSQLTEEIQNEKRGLVAVVGSCSIMYVYGCLLIC